MEDFPAFYCCVGLWSSFFTAIYALFDMSRLMKWSTRSTEEIFALFISIAFCVDAFRDTVKSKNKVPIERRTQWNSTSYLILPDFKDNYFCDTQKNGMTLQNQTSGVDSLGHVLNSKSKVFLDEFILGVILRYHEYNNRHMGNRAAQRGSTRRCRFSFDSCSRSLSPRPEHSLPLSYARHAMVGIFLIQL